tara:strand:- start:106 stop:1308 length:1203 start_codon:yes stop_codon:yes gene_type:complete
MGLITENNRQYYEGAQQFQVPGDAPNQKFTTTFDTNLVFGGYDPAQVNYPLNNFKIYKADIGSLTYTEYILPYSISENTITIVEDLDEGQSFVIQLKTLNGGNYGDQEAYGTTVEENYGGYAYVSLDDIVTNFIVGYVGNGKLISHVDKYDVIFHAKRGLQEFSYDTLKSIKSKELTIPNNLSLALPQDYVDYVKFSWVDGLGVKHIIYPTTLTSNPTEAALQDGRGTPVQDQFNNNIETEPIIEERWRSNDTKRITGNYNQEFYDADINQIGWNSIGAGQRYGLTPETSQINGWFTINERTNKASFSSNLVNKIVIFEYVSDGLAYDEDTKVPKMAEEALYAHISHAIIASRVNQPEYIVSRLKRERTAKLRNTKIRLSNIKLSEITQIMRNKSKWIKH